MTNSRQLALEALKAMLSNYEGVFDCIDNAGERYQSQAAADAEQLTREAIAALESELAQEVEPVTREALPGAIARGWCSPKNSHKEMDSDLALAIGDEVAKLYTAPQPAAPEPVNAELLAACKSALAVVGVMQPSKPLVDLAYQLTEAIARAPGATP